jgi:hypothetical protein
MTGSLRSLWLPLLLLAPGSFALAEERAENETRISDIRFREVSREWGIDFRHHQGGAGEFYMPESMASGLAIFDYDDDGDEDVLLVDGGAMRGYDGEPPRSRLYRNDGPGRFLDVSGGAGIEVTGDGMGATAGDADGDGDQDLYVTAWGENQLFRNNGDGTFTDVTATAGVGGGEKMWTASAAFADVDGDGDLDLYATNYVNFTYDNNPFCGHKELGLRSYCHPDVYDGLPDRFFRNNGDGTFVDDTEGAGFSAAAGKGLGVIFGDLDRDGWIDLYVANDMTANYLFRNRGDGSFEEEGLFSGVAFSDQGAPEAGMGVDMADVDGDGLVEIIVTHLDMQSNALYSSSESGLFMDRRHRSQLAEVSRLRVGFGVAFGDFDRDADVDLVVANGHIIHNIELYGTGGTYRQRNQVFENQGDGRFDLVEEAGFEAVRASRGLAIGDLDGDGDLEVVVNNLDEEVEVYENLSSSGGWLGVDLRGRGPNRRALGTRLELRSGSSRQLREVRSASSYLSQNATMVHFGLGDEPSGELELTVHWPGGRQQILRRFPAERRLMLFEPSEAYR